MGVSGSPGNLPALRYARSVAGWHSAPLVAVHAWLPPGGELADRRQPSSQLRQAWAEAAAQRLRDALGAAWGTVPADPEIQAVVVRAEPGVALVEAACLPDDLLIVGAGQRGRLARLWHGRVTRYCLAHARGPVVSVPPPGLPRPAARGLGAWAFRHRELTLDQVLAQWEDEKLGRSH